ncbi:MAG: exosortase [Deltaproteobacteria bacterium]|nr:exosortase [Deltaproteobacteria bacterium]MBW2723752.1 exosortase [Deltaproteobacteria bacterium]
MTQKQPATEDVAQDLLRKKTLLAIAGALALTTYVHYPILYHMFLTWRTNPDYSHGLLIVPLSLYFAYGKTPQLRRAEIRGSWWGVAILCVGVLSVCIGELGGLLTALRSGYVFALMGLVLLLAGRQVFEILLFPMAFLFLMVPLPQSLVNIIAFPLQLIAAGWAVSSLQAFGIPSLLEGNIIHLAHTQLFVAEACSGLRSLMALLTLGVVFAQFFRAGRLFQQSILVLSAIPIAIVVNAVRVSLTGILTHNFGPEAAGGFIHDFQGIITFSMAFIMLLGEAQLLTVAANLIKRSRAQEASPA